MIQFKFEHEREREEQKMTNVSQANKMKFRFKVNKFSFYAFFSNVKRINTWFCHAFMPFNNVAKPIQCGLKLERVV